MMRVLLDTHLLLWSFVAPKRISSALRALLARPDTEIVYSAANIWEIAIKARLGRADFPVRPARVIEMAKASNYMELPVTGATAAIVADLPLHHRDPFDRLLIAQAIAAPVRLYTSDRRLAPYSELVTVVG
jgi:PIN domain nuclease of toxin-antitoxin system